MFRLKLALIIGGGFLAFFGLQEYRVSMGTSAEPVQIDLAKVEAGETPTNNHWLIGEHAADYWGCVYEYEEDTKRITHLYYPIISDDNPYFDKLEELITKHGGPNNIPEAEYPDVDTFRVLVKTERFKKESAIPDGLSSDDSLQGLVINLIGSMDAEEERLIKQSFPKVNVDDVIILEEGREPASMMVSLGMLGGGVLLILAGLAWLFGGFLS